MKKLTLAPHFLLDIGIRLVYSLGMTTKQSSEQKIPPMTWITTPHVPPDNLYELALSNLTEAQVQAIGKALRDMEITGEVTP